jgi:hypothetical protein
MHFLHRPEHAIARRFRHLSARPVAVAIKKAIASSLRF